MPTRLYSERLGPISDRQLQAALDRFDLGRLIAAEPVPHGHFGQNLFVRSTAGEHVLRGNPSFAAQFGAEGFAVRLLSERTRVPVPTPYRIDPATGVFGWSYVIMPRMPGLQPSAPEVRGRLDAAARQEIARALGGNLAEMHSVTSDSPGRFDARTGELGPLEPADESAWTPRSRFTGPPVTGVPYARWVSDRIKSRLTLACGHNRTATTAGDLAWVRALLTEGAEALAEPFRPCLVMEDYKEGNLVVAQDGGRWRVSGVFDLAESYFGDGEADLARTVCSYLDEDPDLARAFLDAYVTAHPPRAGFAERTTAYLLLDRALLWEFFQRNGLSWWPESWTFRAWAERYLSLMEPVLPA
ncbi:phosphotransferase [Actinomadura sp. DC4]|uniref:phosphotransferase family protein n=1 Tax=Actinomadura sp. DC4 TaxID=3055069 RepID=UPI0025B001E4|nr:phosphotransferase [Actinomadura sp. DC4]MDN3352029.1 phosphotransferase [Actinomadura sp. DC4]